MILRMLRMLSIMFLDSNNNDNTHVMTVIITMKIIMVVGIIRKYTV